MSARRRIRPRGPALVRSLSGAVGARAVTLAALHALAVLVASCDRKPPPDAPTPGPYVLVLGTAQDGGLPQIGSEDPADRAAWRDPSRRRLVASLLVVDPASGKRWLVDATPDLREQVERAAGHPPGRSPAPGQPPPAGQPAPAGRPPLFDGIFLTHAHMGHYAGLMQLGREAYGGGCVTLYASDSMARFLESNAPWELLLRLGYARIERFTSERPVVLVPEISITPIPVPHRAEYTDTHGFLIRGTHHAVLYVPDTDSWDRWDRPVEALVREVDWALLDGTFFAEAEVPGRSMAEIPHPLVTSSLQRFGALPEAERRKILFTHLNHTNPAAAPESDARRRVEAAGMGIAAEGMRLPL